MKYILFGSTGQVGGAVARALADDPTCTGLTLVNRRPAGLASVNAKVNEVILATDAPDFADRVAELARGHAAAVCCVGVGQGTASIPEDQLLRLEVGVVGAYARGCHAAGVERFAVLLAVGITPASAESRIKYVRVMGKKLRALREVGFAELAAFRPGTITGNKHTPRWAAAVAKLLPDIGGYGAIHQDEIAAAFAAHLARGRGSERMVYYDNKAMKAMGAARRAGGATEAN